MLNTFLTYIKEGSVYAGLEICESNGTYSYTLLELKKKKNELYITKEEHLVDLGEITEHIQKHTPLFLTINTTKVLTKKMERVGNIDSVALVDAAFPNLNLENFYYEVIQKTANPIVTISKRDYVDEIIGRIRKLKIDLVYFSLGISTIENILTHLEGSAVTLSNYKLEIGQDGINEIHPLLESATVQYTLNGLELTNRSLLAFAGILGFLGKQFHDSNFNDINNSTKKEFEHTRIFNVGLRASLLFFLLILLLNFFAFDHYFSKVETLRISMELSNSKISELKELEISVTKKQERVMIMTSSSNSKATYYLDEFARMVPPTILLDKITYQPLEKPVRESKSISLVENQILVSGISKSGDLFSQWIVTLEKEDWISSVETMDYDYITSTTSNFLIKIAFREK